MFKKWLKYYVQQGKNGYHFLVALAALIYYRYPARKLNVIGVTGTDGKTTTTTLIYHLLKSAGIKVACVSTVAAYIGEKSVDTGFHVTSPDPWAMQKLLRRIATAKYNHLVLEVTSHGLDQHRVLGTNIQTAVVTNITHEHLDYHPSFNHYIKSKAKIMQGATQVFLNQEDPATKKLQALIKPNQHLHLFQASNLGLYQAAIHARFPGERYNYDNAMAAIAVVRHFGLKDQDIQSAITSFPPVPGRQQLVENSHKLHVIVDFAHTPNALKQALTALKKSVNSPHQLIAVFGAAGLRDHAKRPQMGQIAASLADEVVLTSEDPRTEDPKAIIKQIISGITQNYGHVHSLVDRQQAITFAIAQLAKRGDTIAVFGKGHEQSLNLDGHRETPWSDVHACQKALKARTL